MIGDRGKFDDSVFDDDYEDSQDLPDSLRVTYADLYCEEDNEYYLGNNNPGNVTGDLVKDYMRIRTDFHKDDDFGGDDSGGVAIIHPLLKTLWHQDEPFNLNFHYAPASDTNHPGRRPAGCTTIAAAQIITCLKNLSLEDKFGITTSTWQNVEDVDIYDYYGSKKSISGCCIHGKANGGRYWCAIQFYGKRRNFCNTAESEKILETSWI